MSFNTDIQNLDNETKVEIKRLLKESENYPPQLKDIWYLLDLVWTETGCENDLSENNLKSFYSHQVWILNGIFIDYDKESLMHRTAISHYLKNMKLMDILDFGGGWGTLARVIAKENCAIQIDIYDKYPSRYAIEKNNAFSNIQYVDVINKEYDCLLCMDVLEHVTEPLRYLDEMIGLVKKDGYLFIANNFHPVIQCHLKTTFHFRYTFKYFAYLMGIRRVEQCPGSHAIVYKKYHDRRLNWAVISLLVYLSKALFPVFRILKLFMKRKTK